MSDSSAPINKYDFSDPEMTELAKEAFGGGWNAALDRVINEIPVVARAAIDNFDLEEDSAAVLAGLAMGLVMRFGRYQMSHEAIMAVDTNPEGSE